MWKKIKLILKSLRQYKKEKGATGPLGLYKALIHLDIEFCHEIVPLHPVVGTVSDERLLLLDKFGHLANFEGAQFKCMNFARKCGTLQGIYHVVKHIFLDFFDNLDFVPAEKQVLVVEEHLYFVHKYAEHVHVDFGIRGKNLVVETVTDKEIGIENRSTDLRQVFHVFAPGAQIGTDQLNHDSRDKDDNAPDNPTYD